MPMQIVAIKGLIWQTVRPAIDSIESGLLTRICASKIIVYN